MKYLIVLLEGAASSEPASGKTVLEAANTPELDRLARKGRVGAVHLMPPEARLPPEAIFLTLLGYDAHLYRGRGPVLAAALRVTLGETDVAFCCPLISTDGTTVLSGTIEGLADEDALALMSLVTERLGTRRLSFYPAPQNSSVLRILEGSTAVSTTPPRRIPDKSLTECLPQGEDAERLQRLIYDSLELLSQHPINRRRQDEGLLPANTVWPYGQGTALKLPDFTRRFGVTGAVVANNLLIHGIARAAGLGVVTPPAAGNAARVAAVRGAWKEGIDLILLPVPIARSGDTDDERQEQIERADREVIEPLLSTLEKGEESFRLLCFVTSTAENAAPLPFLLYDAEEARQSNLPFDERAVPETRWIFEEGYRLLPTALR